MTARTVIYIVCRCTIIIKQMIRFVKAESKKKGKQGKKLRTGGFLSPAEEKCVRNVIAEGVRRTAPGIGRRGCFAARVAENR